MFSSVFKTLNLEEKAANSRAVTHDQVESTLRKSQLSITDLPVLISPAASNYLEQMAQRAHQLTLQRFGKAMGLFVPLYLSNICYNRCTYCGFSMDLEYERKVLNLDEVKQEADILKAKGFQHILLLTGEAPDKAGVDYLESVITLLKPDFASIGLEVQPLKQPEYERLIQAGAVGLTVYQETYHRETYLDIHLSGKKRQFDNRLNTPDFGGQAGFYRINIGALLGLADWRFEALALGHHLDYCRKAYWQTTWGMSVPRLKDCKGAFKPIVSVSDADLTQYICAFRLIFPDVMISLSTREPENFRNNVLPLGITDISAESSTEPGGYSGQETGEQFKLSDNRTLKEVQTMLNQKGYEPVLKDWN